MTQGVPTASEFVEWMEQQGFTNITLAAALDCSRSSVWKWASGKTPIETVTWLACQYVAGGAADAKRRKRSLEAVDGQRRVARRLIADARREAEQVASARRS